MDILGILVGLGLEAGVPAVVLALIAFFVWRSVREAPADPLQDIKDEIAGMRVDLAWIKGRISSWPSKQ